MRKTDIVFQKMVSKFPQERNLILSNKKTAENKKKGKPKCYKV